MKINPGEGGPSGGPTPAAQQQLAARQRLALGSAKLTVRVQKEDGTILPEAPLRFTGSAVASLVYDEVEQRVDVTLTAAPPASGEANTASNIGAAGVGIFKDKSGVDLRFKKLNAASTKVTIADDTPNDEVDIDVVPANILLQDCGGAVIDAQIPAGIARDSEITSAIAAHEAAADPHPLYALESALGALASKSSIATADLDADAVTFAKIQNVATATILGRATAGSGDIEEIAPAHSIQVDGTGVRLVGDAAAPGSSKVYGTDASGVKGWKPDPAGGSSREDLVAHWDRQSTKSNIGTAFVDVYTPTNGNGLAVEVDFSGKTQVAAIINWNKVGSGTQTVRAVDADTPANVLFTKDVVSGSNLLALTALPGWATGVKKIKLQAKSTTGTDDPVFESCAVRLK